MCIWEKVPAYGQKKIKLSQVLDIKLVRYYTDLKVRYLT